MHSYDQERHIREEEQIRADERKKIVQNEIDKRERAQREENDLDYLREVSQVHGIGAAYLIRLTPYLITGTILGVLAALGTFTGNNANASFFHTLWEAIKNFGIGFGCLGLYGLWRCRNI